MGAMMAGMTDVTPKIDDAKPFMKSVGGKSRLVPRLMELVPAGTFAYHEPFIGGGALFLALANARRLGVVNLGDTNGCLVAAWREVDRAPAAFAATLAAMPNERRYFERLRTIDPERLDQHERGARFVFLNKTCFNGLHRVNRKGLFNVPFADYEKPLIADEANLLACSHALRSAEVRREDFGAVSDRAKPGDVIFFDPPYIPVRVAGGRSFTGYTVDGFTMADQERLRDLAAALARKGVKVLVSNSSAPEAAALYENVPELVVERVHMRRSVNRDGAGRGEVPELLIRSRD